MANARNFVYLLNRNIVDLLSDALLVATPVVVFSKLNLPAPQRRLITAVFCGSVTTGLSVIVFAVFTFSGWNLGRDTPLIFLGLSSIEVNAFDSNVRAVLNIFSVHSLYNCS